MYQSIEELEGSRWPKAKESDTSLIRDCHALRKKPINQLSPNEFRLAFSQQVGADFLKNAVVSILEKNPVLDSMYYAGDLLLAVMRSKQFTEDSEFGIKIRRCLVGVPLDQLDDRTRVEVQAFISA